MGAVCAHVGPSMRFSALHHDCINDATWRDWKAPKLHLFNFSEVSDSNFSDFSICNFSMKKKIQFFKRKKIQC